MNNPQSIDRPVWVFFILALIVGVLAHFQMSAGGDPLFTEYYGFDTARLFYWDSVSIGFVFFWAATVLAYQTFKGIFLNNKWAFLAVLLFYLSPFIMGSVTSSSLYQYLVTFLLVNFYLTKKFIDKPDLLYGILLAFVHVLLIYIYPCLVVLPVLTFLFFILNIFSRNLEPKASVFLLPYFLGVIGLCSLVHFGLKIPVSGPLPDFSIFPHSYSWSWYIRLILNFTPPLFLCYFVFSIVALNVIYFSDYFQFLKKKWIYTYSFFVPVTMLIAEKFIISGSYGIRYSLLVISVSMLIIAISGCFEFASWVRKRWGDKVYFIFKILFFTLLAIQALVCVIVFLYVYPHYAAYRNWPLFFLR